MRQKHRAAQPIERFSRRTRLSLPLLAALLLLRLSPCSLHAVPYSGDSLAYEQPDRSRLEVRLFGDEFFAVQETADGYVVVRDPQTGFFCYAKVSDDGREYLSTGHVAGRTDPDSLGLRKHARIDRGARLSAAEERQRAMGFDRKGRPVALASDPPDGKDSGAIFPLSPPSSMTTGTRIGLVIMARFPDRLQDATIPHGEVDAYCNQPGYTNWDNNGSVHDYFQAQSRGRLSYTASVTPYFTAARSRSYYTDWLAVFGVRARELMIEGLDALKARGFDFSHCDGNGDGAIDGVNLFYAGSRVNAWGEGLWPHGSIVTWTNAPSGITKQVRYQVSDMGTGLTLGTYCHENGHMTCGLPDLYDYDLDSLGAGRYSLMAAGGSNAPVNVDAYLKSKAGWADAVALDSGSHFRAATRVDGETVYRYRNPANSNEYFLVELRMNSGGYERSAPDQGLALWHVDEAGNNSLQAMTEAAHYEASIEQADGLFHLERNIDHYSNDLYHAGNATEFADFTFPDARWWAGATAGTNGTGETSGLHIHSIGALGNAMTFVVGSGSVTGAPALMTDQTSLVARCSAGTSAPAQKLAVWNPGDSNLTYSIACSAAWVTCSPTSGTIEAAAEVITVSFATAALAAGVYSATLTVAADDPANGSTQSVAVVLTVEPRPAINLSTPGLSVYVPQGLDAEQWFELRNTGGGLLSYAVGTNRDWIAVEPGSGTALTETDAILAKFLSSEMLPGRYLGKVTVTSADAANSPQSVNITLNVQPHAGHLLFTSDTCRVEEPEGLIRLPVNRLHSISGAVTVDFSVTGETALAGEDFVPTNGTLTFASGVTNAEIAVWILDDSRKEKPETFRVWLSNPGGGASLLSPTGVVVTIVSDEPPLATLPLIESFDSVPLAAWWDTNSTGVGRIRVASEYGPHSSPYHLLEDAFPPGVYSLNELTLAVDLAAHRDVTLSFWHKELNDEDHPMPSTFVGHANADGVAISSDQTNWYRLQGLTSADGISTFYRPFDLDLHAMITNTPGLYYTNPFLIRFQHYDDGAVNSDGFAFDDIVLTKTTRYALQVHTAYGTATPAPGTYTNVFWAALTNAAASPDRRGGTQYVCTGWTLAGNADTNGLSSGNSTGLVLHLTNNAVLTWNWRTQYWFQAQADLGGALAAPSNGWYDAGHAAALTAMPVSGFAFTGWSGDLPAAQTNSPAISLAITQARALTARFALDTNQVRAAQSCGLDVYRAGSNLTSSALEFGTNTVACQFNYPSDQSLASLVWSARLPPGWTIISASGDGSPQPQGTNIIFSTPLVNHPVRFWYEVAVPCASPFTNRFSGTAAFRFPNLSQSLSIPASPSPYPLKRAHSSDYRLSAWAIDGPEASRALAYWRAGAYYATPLGLDGYAPGAGPTNSYRHSADYRDPAWLIDGLEVSRLLAYWRAGGYHVNPAGADGYAPGAEGEFLGLGQAEERRGPALLAAPPAGLAFPSASQTCAGYRTPGTNVVACAFAYPPGIRLLGLCWRPSLPAGWQLDAAAGDGSPEVQRGDIVLTGLLATNPVLFTYTVLVPPGEAGPRQIDADLYYQWDGMPNPVLARANPDPLTLSHAFYLQVASAPGDVSPAPGTHLFAADSSLVCEATNSPGREAGLTTQFVATGWSGTGSVTSGTGSRADLVLTNDSEIAWLWRTNYWLETAVRGSGSVTPGSDWREPGSVVTACASPGLYHYFAGWTGTLSSASNPLAVTVDQACSLAAMFDPNLATNATPQWWLAVHGLTNRGWDAEATDDQDGDGARAWEEHQADTDPTSRASVLALTGIRPADLSVRLDWKGGTGAWQYLERRLGPAAPGGSWTPIFTNRPPTAAETNWTDDRSAAEPRFYRIRAERP